MKDSCAKCRRSYLQDEMWWVMPPVLPKGSTLKAYFVCVDCW